MFRNLLTITYRSLLKNGASTAINITGLAVGMAAFLFIITYVQSELSYERFHKNSANIFRITLDVFNGSEYVVTDCETHQTMGPLLKETEPEVLDFVRMFHCDGEQEIAIADKKFLDEGMYYADESVFNVFTLKVVKGKQQGSLTPAFRAVLTASTAKRYFGSIDVVGKTVKIDNNDYAVTAVIDDLPFQTHLKFNVLLSHATLEQLYDWYMRSAWSGNNEYTYLLMQPGTNLHAFNNKLKTISASLKDKLDDDRYQAEAITDIHLHSTKSFEPEPPGNARVVNFMLIIAAFIILLAWVNYVNLSTARAVDRGREVGIRKVMGSPRLQLVMQFMFEALIINVIAGTIACVLFYASRPLFEQFTGQPFPASLVQSAWFWGMFALLLAIGAVLSGIYPAFVLSSFKPVSVLKGKLKSSGHGQQLRKVLVTLQFGATLMLLVALLVVFLQIDHLRRQDLGMKLEQTLVLRAPGLGVPDSLIVPTFTALKNELSKHRAVKTVSFSTAIPGVSLHALSTTSNVNRLGAGGQGGSYNYYFYAFDLSFMNTMGMTLVAGRPFEKTSGWKQVIINEEAASRLGFASAEEAIGSRITFNDDSEIIGVVKNFHQRSPKEPFIPMIFRYSERPDFISVVIDTKDVQQTISELKSTWDKTLPNTIFHYFFMDENYNQQYQADARFGNIVGSFSVLAIIIACLGLFGLSSFTIVQRTKEIGIRKVLGASVLQIVKLLSADFVKLVLIASVLALPLAWYGLNEWLSSYASRVTVSWWMPIVPVIAMLLIALATVSFQTIKTAISNPSDSLKHE